MAALARDATVAERVPGGRRSQEPRRIVLTARFFGMDARSGLGED